MGGIINVVCKCGFKTDYMGGSGKENFDKVCYAPALCRNCHLLIVGNYIDENSTCEKCDGEIIYYNDPQLQATSENTNTFENLNRPELFILPSVKCECPKCGQKEMRFTHVGCWQ